MATFCITAANHNSEDKDNHCASEFNVWKRDDNASTGAKTYWNPPVKKSIYEVCDLLKDKHTVYSATKESNGDITLGEPIMIELRISKNGSNYKISEMPNF